jgi:hypothetical protein
MRYFRAATLAAFALLSLWSAGCGGGSKPVVRTFPMGERVELGHVIYSVFETQWLTQLGEGLEARVPEHRFFLVRLSAANSGNADVNPPAMSIVDDNGNTYPELTNGDKAPQWIGYLRSVKPAEALQGNVLFDAPPRHYKLRVTDENEDKTAFIDIPLSFGAETPEMPGPGPAGNKQ